MAEEGGWGEITERAQKRKLGDEHNHKPPGMHGSI